LTAKLPPKRWIGLAVDAVGVIIALLLENAHRMDGKLAHGSCPLPRLVANAASILMAEIEAASTPRRRLDSFCPRVLMILRRAVCSASTAWWCRSFANAGREGKNGTDMLPGPAQVGDRG
jgi:hypothetical protein